MRTVDLAANLLRWSGGIRLLRRIPAWSGILVLNYHRIGEPDATPYDRDLFSARVQAFDDQMAYLAGSCEVIKPEDIPDVRERKRGRFVLVTFDDGYRDNYELAYPVLRAHGVPATFFICTGFIDRPHLAWWDEIAWMIRTSESPCVPGAVWFTGDVPITGAHRTDAVRAALDRYKELPGDRTTDYLAYLRDTTGRNHPGGGTDELWMTWDMIREMQAGGMTIGAHTMRHQLLSRLPDAEQEDEIRGSRDRIAAETGRVPSAFAYPVGSRAAFTETTKALLRKLGFSWGFAFYGGLQRLDPFDPYEIRRAHVGPFISQSVFEAMTAYPRVFARW